MKPDRFGAPVAILVSDESDSCAADLRGRLGALNRGGMGMLDGSRYFAEFPDENPDRVPLNPTVLCALVALEREISRIQTEPETKIETAGDGVSSENG